MYISFVCFEVCERARIDVCAESHGQVLDIKAINDLTVISLVDQEHGLPCLLRV